MKNQPILSAVFFSFLIIISGISFAQQPAWVDYAKRTSAYPDSDYLVGFISAHNNNDEDPGKLMDQYEELAKSKVIQSIQVSIETNNSLMLSNVNGKSGEEFQSNSISFSSATITGLTAERYYDKKKKDIYAFAYVSKKQLAYYNRKLISSNLEKINQKLTAGREYLQVNDKQNALKSFYEGMPLLAEAEEAQWLLMAVNREQFVEKDLQTIREKKIELNKEISLLQQSEALSLSEAAYFVAYGLFVQLNELAYPVKVDFITYENTGLTSDFSDLWDLELKNGLVKTGNYKLQEKEKTSGESVVMKGNYWKEGIQLRIQVQAIKNNKIQAAAEGSVSLSWLNGEKIDYLPEQLAKIDRLQNIKLIAVGAPEEIKIGIKPDKPIEVRVIRNNINGHDAIENIPLIFSTNEGTLITKGFSNSDGLVSVYFPAINLPQGNTKINAQIDLATYADIDPNSAFYIRALKNNPVMPAEFVVKFIPIIYFVNTKEKINNRPVEIKTIEPTLKKTLSDQGIQFADTEMEADFIINVNATTTSGSSYQGVYFSFVDATLSVVDVATGMETFKTSVEQVKGGGSNTKKAGIKALNLASDKLNETLMDYLSTH